jgi:hypothetical protein
MWERRLGGPAAEPEEGELMKQLKLLPRILVRVAISVKIAISIRRR